MHLAAAEGTWGGGGHVLVVAGGRCWVADGRGCIEALDLGTLKIGGALKVRL
jgi:hypothetical protein